MTTKFFGQFLLECGEIDEAELRLALELMEKENLTLGEFAVRSGFATEADCRRVNGEQRRKDVPFGELAVHMGVLNSVELEELLQRQRETRLELSTALVNLEFLPADRMHALSDAFKSEQRQLLPGEVELPPALARHPVAAATVRRLVRFCQRVGRLEVKVGSCVSATEVAPLPDEVLVASLVVRGIQGMTITMIVSGSFGEKLAVGILGMELAELASELALEAVGEFLNVLVHG